MQSEKALTLIDPKNGNLAFKIFSFEDNSHFDHVQRNNYYSILLVLSGNGKIKADFSAYELNGASLLCFAPYQPFIIGNSDNLNGIALNFHPDFFCIFRHQNEVASEGILFNNPIHPSFFNIPENESSSIYSIIELITAEMRFAGLAQQDILIAYLKILLIRAIRIKFLKTTTSLPLDRGSADATLLRELKKMIEIHFRTKHNGGEYADLLKIPIKTLGRIVKNNFQRTLTEIISERVVLEAKRELNLTSKTVKEIAFYLGFDDKYHFSRYFKNKTGISPQSFRDSLKNAALPDPR